MRWRRVFVLISLLLISCPGCGPGNEQNRQPLSGQVTLDGDPLEAGSISFEPLDATGEAIRAGAAIQDGAFRIDQEKGLPPGKYRVRISAGRPAGDADQPAKLPGAPRPVIVPKSIIPAKYNMNSELEVEIVEGDENEFDFDLVSDPTAANSPKAGGNLRARNASEATS